MRKIYSKIFTGLVFKNKVGQSILGLLFALLAAIPGNVSGQSINVTNVNPTTVCAGSDVTITFSVTNGGAGLHFSNSTTYQVFLSDASGSTYTGIGTFSTTGITYSADDAGVTPGITATITLPSTLASGSNYKIALGSTSPTVVGSNGNGASPIFTINAQVKPSVSIVSDDGDNNICSGTLVNFTATPINGGSPSYQWYIGTTPVGSNSYIYSSNSLSNGDVVTVVMTSNATCATPATVTSNSITMTVNAPVLPAVTISTPSNSVCAGASTTFTAATPTNGGTNPTYQWQISTNGGGSYSGIGGATNTTYSTTTLAAGDIIRLQMNSSALCASPNPVTSNEITISIKPDATISLTSASGTDNQVKCINTAITPIKYTIGGGGTGGSVSGLPSGVSYSFGAGVLTISGTPTQSGTFNYTVNTTGTCAQTSATGTITVNPDASISLTTANNNQTLCEKIAIAAIKFNVGGTGNNASVTGLPSGVTGSYSGGVFTISGTPSVSGTFAYTVTATGTCGSATATGTLTVNPDATISLTSGSGTNNQSKCINTAITAIKYTIGGGGTGGTVSGLPSGVSYSFSAGVLTISGTPTQSGTFNYTVNTTGTCAQTSATGTITVNPDASISLTTANNNQTLCEKIAIAAIKFNVGGTGNNASVTGLPSGVTGSYSGGVFTISGTPSVSGTFAYTVTATGTCGSATATGSLTVNPDATISLTSGSGTNNQSKCINTAITPIKYTIGGGGTGGTVSGLPSGVSYSFSAGVLTISGTPTQSGTFNYTVNTTGTCAQTSATGTITVNPDASISLTTGNNNQTICINTAVANISYSISGGGTGATVSGLPSGLTGSYNGGNFVISGTPIVSGTFNYTVSTSGTCGQVTATGTITVTPDATLALTSSASTTSQNVCVGTSIAAIRYSITGTSNYTVNGLPAGVSASINSGVITISGTPNNSIGSTTDYNYTIKTTGTCNNVTLTGHIKVWVGGPSASWGGFPITFTPSGSICPPATLQFSVSAATNVQYYKWTLPSGWTISSGDSTNNITVSVTTASSTGYQTVSVSAVNPCGNVSASTKNKELNVNSFTGVTVSPTTQSVCAGGSITVVGTLTGNAVSGTWTGGSGSFSNVVTSTTSPVTVTATYTPSIMSGNEVLTITTNTPTGCSTVPGTAQVTVTVNQPSTAPTSESASVATICNGGSSTLTQTGGSLGTGAIWKWYSNSSYTTLVGTSSAADGSLSVSPTTTTTYYVRAESTTGAPCTANVAGAGSVTVTVNQPSVAPASLAASTGTICSGSSTTLTQTGGSLGTGASWKWYSDATYTTLVGSGSGSNASLSVSPTTTTTYYLQIEGGTAPCSATLQGPAAGVTVTVNQPSTAPTSESASVATICNGGSSTLTQTGGSLGTGAIWKWYSNSSYTTLVGTSSAADGSLSVSPTTTTTYYVRAESTTGAPCTANVAGAGSVTVTVNQPSVAPASLAASTGTICSGSSTTLTQTGGSLGTGASWKWYSDATYTTLVGSGSGSNASLSVSPTTTTTYYLQIEGGTAPCSATLQGPAAGVTVTVNQPSTAPTSESASVATICNGGSSTLTQTGGSLGTGAIWKWYSNSSYTTLVGTSSAADGSLSVSPTTTTIYYVRAESTTGAPCTANVAGAGSVTVTVNQPSVAPASLAASTGTICSGSSTTLTQTGGSLGTGASWKWYSDATYTTLVGSGSGSNASLSVSPTTTTTYYLQIEGGTAPCSATLQGPAAGVTVSVNQPSVAPTAESASVPTICSGSSTTLTQTGGSLGTGAIWKWYSNSSYTTLVGTSSAADGSLSVSPTTTTTYYVRAESTTGAPCTANVAGAGSVTVTVNQPVVINTQPQNFGTCASTPAQLGVVASGDGLTYQWYKGTIGSGTAVSNSSNISGATSNILKFAQADLADAGSYYVIVSGASPCASVTSNQVTLNVDKSISFPTQPQSKTVCVNAASVTFTVAAEANGDVLNYQWRKNGTNIGGATSTSFTINNVSLSDAGDYDVLVTGPSGYTCSSAYSAKATLTVNDNSTITLSSASGTDAQTLCINSSLTSIKYTVGGGGTGATITSGSLPAGVTGTYSAGVFTISGTPTEAGNFSYTITTTGPCNNATASGTIKVNDNSTITLTSAAGTDGQTQCINTGITNITYAVGGAGTGASITSGSLPDGVTGTYSAGVFTISGTPTKAGTFNYTITTDGPCNNVTASGTITVNDNSSINLSSATGTDGQTVCINNAITNITYAIGGGGNGASITAGSLPAGVTGIYSAGVFTISGTPTVPGNFSYTITTSGPCNNVTATGTISVTANSTISLSSAAGTDAQNICVNTPVTDIKYTIGGGGNGASITTGSLPAGVTGSFSAGVFTISGTPTASGDFPFTITASGTCNNATISGILHVTANSTISLTSGAGTDAQDVCINSAVSKITYTIGGGGTGASIISGSLPAGITGSYNNGVFTISGTPTVSGSFPYTISTTGSCNNVSASGTITVDNPSVGGTLSIAGVTTTPNNVIALCPTTSTVPNSATINLGGSYVGMVIRWDSSSNGGTTWNPVAGTNTGTSLTVTNVTKAAIYRAVVQSGQCSEAYSSIAVVSVIPPYTPPSIHVTKSVVCLGQSTYLSAPDAGLPLSIGSGSGDFQNANPPGWRKDGQSTGDYLPSNSSNNSTGNPWFETTNTGTSTNNTYNGIAYNSPDPKFAMVDGNVNSILETPVFSLALQTTASLDFIQAYQISAGAWAKVEISTDGGNTYSTLLASYSGTSAGISDNPNLKSASISLANYVGMSNLRIRFNYKGNATSAWAIDGISTPGSAIATNLTWGGTLLDTYTGTSVTATPQVRGVNYFVDSTFVNGCYSGSDTIPITALIGANFTSDQKPKTSTVCVGDVATFQGTPTGDSLVFVWERSTDNGTTWTTVSNGGAYAIQNTFDYATATNNKSELTINTTLSNLDDLYRLTANNPGCGAQTEPAPILMNYVWKGTYNINWSDARNWDAGKVPDDNCYNVYILGNTPTRAVPNDPTIDYVAPGIINLVMEPSAKLTINNTGLLTVAGHIDVSQDPYSLIARYGSVNLNGPHASPLSTLANQTIDAHTFYNNDLYNLNLDNSSRIITSSDSLNIYGTLSFGTPITPYTFAGGGNKTFVTSNLLTLKSNIDRTANIADMNNGNASDIGNKISGDVIVERFVNVGPHFRGWQFLSAPITPEGQTIKQSWMENGLTPTGYGTWITGPYAGVDYFTYTPSLKYYLPNVADTSGTPDSWLGVPDTKNKISNVQGYMIFIRSDRGAPYPTPIVMRPTTLRAKGPVWQPNNPAPQSVVDAGLFQSVGNPYASAVDWSTMLGTGGFVNLEQSITIWDPNLGGVYGFGGYQTISSIDGYKTSIATAAYPNSPIKTVESGQAFFVRSTGASGSVNFNENNKVNSSRLVTRTASELNADRLYFRARLYSLSGIPLDGNSTVFSSDFSNKIDGYDSHKIGNSGPNFGLIRNGDVLAVEARNQIIESDTIHYDMWNMAKGNYQLRFGPENMGKSSVSAELIDNYLNSRTSILVNDTTRYNFEVNGDAKSAATNRFIIVFKRINTPVRFVLVHGQQKNEGIEVSWEVTNEEMVSRYEIEESSDGQSFLKAAQVNWDSKKAGQYNWLDQHVREGVNYYRIKVINKDGSVAYSQTVSVDMGSLSPLISIYPNPITNGIIHIHFNHEPEGAYALRLMNQLGQVILARKIIHAGGNSDYPIKWDYNMAHGLYQLEIVKPGGGIKIIKVIY